jgi:hypothetical protein
MNEFGPIKKFGESPGNQIARVETLSKMHAILHGGEKDAGITSERAKEFIQGKTGEPAVDGMGFCNLCNKHEVADGGKYSHPDGA